MNYTYFYLASICLLLFGVHTTAHSQTVLNPSFEMGPGVPARGYIGLASGNNSVTNWTIENGTVDYIGPFWTSSDGNRSFDMNGSSAGTISQTISTTIGESYTMYFDMSGNPSCPGEDIKSLLVTAGDFSGTFDFDVRTTSRTNMGWEKMTVVFTAISASTIIRFASLEAGSFCGAALDNIRLVDCAGLDGGSAVIDDCGNCLHPTDPNFNNCTDCNGTVNGTAILDACGECLEPNDPDFNQSCLDCNGTINGTAILDVCGMCLEPTDPDFNQSCVDCNGTVNGTAILDNCGGCLEPTDPNFNQSCEDCNGVIGGSAIIDSCGVCLDPNNPNFNSCLDCNGVPNGTAIIDDCGMCIEPTDPTFNQTCLDCNGVPFGQAILDECGVCLEPTDQAFNQSCADCNGTPNGTATIDTCGVCLEISDTTRNSCIDCNGIIHGSAVLDSCRTCLDPLDPDFLIVCPDSNIVYIPTAFSPNGDANNDMLRVFATDGRIARIKSYLVFDRWGTLIFKQTDFDAYSFSKWWNGRADEKVCDVGIYVYLIEIQFSDGVIKQYQGDVTLLK